MIDTDKYEGHLASEGQTWVWSKWMTKNNETIEQYNATAALLNDAPLLLEYVKGLTKTLELIGKNMPYDSWMHTLIKDVIGFEKWQAKEWREMASEGDEGE